MYNIKLYDYVPKPQPAHSDKIVAAHYYPAWTKGENGLNHEFDDIRKYPERTPLMGYYEDINPEVIDWEIKWAIEHGINCFIYCWYRRRENLGKPLNLEGLRLEKGLHQGFFNAKYQNMINFAIMFETQPRWGSANTDDLINNVLPFWFENYFCRDNYLKIDNKPIVFFYDTAHQLRDELGGDSEMKKALNACREIAKQNGYDGIIFAEQLCGKDVGEIENSKARGIDFVFSYDWVVEGVNPDSETIYQKQIEYNKKYIEYDPYSFTTTVSQFKDPEPRLKTMPFIPYGNDYWYIDFEHYRKLLKDVKALSDAAPKDSIANKLIMLDNFNEWDEGHYLSPSYRFGFKHLQAIREELSNRDNLPDYRTPESLGFGPYDSTWGQAIDLLAYNDRKLDNGEFTQHRYE